MGAGGLPFGDQKGHLRRELGQKSQVLPQISLSYIWEIHIPDSEWRMIPAIVPENAGKYLGDLFNISFWTSTVMAVANYLLVDYSRNGPFIG